MSREVRRVPLDFDLPIGETWPGFFPPKRLELDPCPDCESGYSPEGELMQRQWYGTAPFDPASTGSAPFTPATPAVRARAAWNVANSPSYYGSGEGAIQREAHRLCGHWNRSWMHHLHQLDVDALVKAERLRDLTHRWVDGRWEPRGIEATAALVNEWSLSGWGHDAINASVVMRARAEREGVRIVCATCDGHAYVEAWPGQRAESEAWEAPEPPTGEGWQMWQTVSEGGPVSPVFDTPEGLATWMRGDRWPHLTHEQAMHFVVETRVSFGTLIGRGGDVVDGVTAAATQEGANRA